MDLSALVDTLVPGPDGRLDRASLASQALVARAADTPAGRPVALALHGNGWLGHPAHPIAVTLPVGAWATSAWYDVRSLVSPGAGHEQAADAALRFGIATSLVAAATGLAQYLDTRGQARRETTVHSALNTASLALYVGSWAARRSGRRSTGRRLSALALSVTGASGYLGGDLSYRHGVGVRPQALRSRATPAHATSSAVLQTADAVHR
ncbi:MAG: uncharacterized protein JWN17_100 [Frankiales bacterium]|nr:uncharacterized protein [Frankiales bacterium]